MQDETAFRRADGLWQRGDRVFDDERNDVTPFVSPLGRSIIQIDRDHERELKDNGGQVAVAETWAKYARLHTVALWRGVALLCCVDPADWSLQQMRRVSFCRWRLDLAIEEAARERDGWLGTFDQSPDPAERYVRLDRVRNWAQRMMLPIPLHFPDVWGRQIDFEAAARPADLPLEAASPEPSDSAEVSTSVAKPRARGRARSDAATKTQFVRLNELLEKVVPFSKATLYRKVKTGEFPKPISLSAGISVWRRSDVDAWVIASMSGS